MRLTDELGHQEMDVTSGRCRVCGVFKIEILKLRLACHGSKHPLLGVTLPGDTPEDEQHFQDVADGYAEMFGTPENLAFVLRQRLKGMLIGRYYDAPRPVFNARENNDPLTTSQLLYYPKSEVANGSPDRP